MVQFQVGQEKLFLSLGPNTTDFPGEWAVVGVLYDREIGKSSMSATLGDLLSEETKRMLSAMVQPPKNLYLVRIRGSKEIYDVRDKQDLAEFLASRQPKPEDVELFERAERK